MDFDDIKSISDRIGVIVLLLVILIGNYKGLWGWSRQLKGNGGESIKDTIDKIDKVQDEHLDDFKMHIKEFRDHVKNCERHWIQTNKRIDDHIDKMRSGGGGG